MTTITQQDREIAAKIMLAGGYNSHDIVQIVEASRIETERRIVEWLRRQGHALAGFGGIAAVPIGPVADAIEAGEHREQQS